MYELTVDETQTVSGAVRLEEAATGFVALGVALALGPFTIAAGVAFAGAFVLEGMYDYGM